MRHWLWLLAVALGAHELDVAVRIAPPAVLLEARYGGTEIVPFAKVQIFAPGATREFQTGRTDQRGRFSFVPEGAGNWRAVVDDELGHRREVEIGVTAGFAGVVDGGSGGSRWDRLLAGLGLLAGVAGVWYGWSARRRPRA